MTQHVEMLHHDIEFDPLELAHWLQEYKSSLQENNNIRFAIAKIRLLNSAAYGLYGLSAGLNLNDLYKANNRFEEACHIGFLMLTGSAGWDLGVTAAATASTALAFASSLPVLIAAGICGSIAVNLGANEVWDAYLDKIQKNIALDRDNQDKISVLPLSFFNPIQDKTNLHAFMLLSCKISFS